MDSSTEAGSDSSSSRRRRGKRDKDKNKPSELDNDNKQPKGWKKKKMKMKKKISNNMVVAKTILMSKLLRRNRRLNDGNINKTDSSSVDPMNHNDNFNDADATLIYDEEQCINSSSPKEITKNHVDRNLINTVPSTHPNTNIIKKIPSKTSPSQREVVSPPSKSYSHYINLDTDTEDESPQTRTNLRRKKKKFLNKKNYGSTSDMSSNHHKKATGLHKKSMRYKKPMNQRRLRDKVESENRLKTETNNTHSPDYLMPTLSSDIPTTPERKYRSSVLSPNVLSPSFPYTYNDSDEDFVVNPKKEKKLPEVFTFNRIRSFSSIIAAGSDSDDTSSIGASIDDSIGHYNQSLLDHELFLSAPPSPNSYVSSSTQLLPLLMNHSFDENRNNIKTNITKDTMTDNDLEWSEHKSKNHVENCEKGDENIPLMVPMGNDMSFGQNSLVWKKSPIESNKNNQIVLDLSTSPSLSKPNKLTSRRNNKSKKISSKNKKVDDKKSKEQIVSIFIGTITALSAISTLIYTTLQVTSNSNVFDVTTLASSYPKMLLQIVWDLPRAIYITIIASVLTLFFGIHLPLQVQRKAKKKILLQEMIERKKKKIQQFKSVNRHLKGLLTGYRVKEVRQDNLVVQLRMFAGYGPVSPSMVVTKTKELVEKRKKIKEQLRAVIAKIFMKCLVLSNNNTRIGISTTMINQITLSLLESKLRQIPYIQYHPNRLNGLIQKHGSSFGTVIRVYKNLHDDGLEAKDRIFILPFS